MATVQHAVSTPRLTPTLAHTCQAGISRSARPSFVLARAGPSGALYRSRLSHGLQGQTLQRVDGGDSAFGQRRQARSRSLSGAARCAAAGAAAGGSAEEDPYQVLGVSPLKGFDGAMVAHRKKMKEAERKGDKEAMDRYDAAYNKIMMRQLDMRRKGFSVGSLEVSKDIKYADNVAMFPWLPRPMRPTRNDLLINVALSGVFALWVVATGSAEWKALQFMVSAYVIRTWVKLKALAGEAPRSSEFSEEEEEEGGGGGRGRSSKRDAHNRKILLRSMGLVFSCVALAAVGYTALQKGYVAMGVYPRWIATGQELIITVATAAFLFIITTWYR